MDNVRKTLPFELDGNSSYLVRVRSVNSFGVPSEWSEITRVNTGEAGLERSSRIVSTPDGLIAYDEDGNIIFQYANSTTARINLVVNPSLEVNADGWLALTSSLVTRDTGSSFAGAAGCMRIAASASASGVGVVTATADRQTALVDEFYTAAAFVKVPTGTPDVIARIGMRFYNSGGTQISQVLSPTSTTITDEDGWVRISCIGVVAPEGTSKIGLVLVNTANQAIGNYFLADAFILEKSQTLREYFDGSSSSGSTAWSGDEHNSTSVMSMESTYHIDRANITEGTFKTSRTADSTGGIVVDPTGLTGYSPLGDVKVFIDAATGDITATEGTFTGSTFRTNTLVGSGSPNAGSGVIFDDDGIRGYSGVGLDPIFRLDTDGALFAADATISGSITATTGIIGGFTVGLSTLTAGLGADSIGLSTGQNTSDIVIYTGESATPTQAPFRVRSDGSIYAGKFTLLDPEDLTESIFELSSEITDPSITSASSGRGLKFYHPDVSAANATPSTMEWTSFYSPFLGYEIGSLSIYGPKYDPSLEARPSIRFSTRSLDNDSTIRIEATNINLNAEQTTITGGPLLLAAPGSYGSVRFSSSGSNPTSPALGDVWRNGDELYISTSSGIKSLISSGSTTVSFNGPVITLGGATPPMGDDDKDRGVQFRWHNGSTSKIGYFGFDDSTGKFTFIPDATNTSDVFSGTKGELDATLATTNLSGTLQDAQFPALTGDVTTTAGSLVTAIAAGVIVNADINASAGIVDTKLATISTANKVSLTALDIDGGTDIGAALADADLIIVDDGGAGTNRKAAATRIPTYVFSKVSGDVLIDSSGVATIQANSVALGTDTTGNYIATIAGTTNQVNVSGSGSETAAVTLSLPQNVHTSATPTFTQVNLNEGNNVTHAVTLSRLGATATSGALDWNDGSNTRPGTGYTLLLGNASNGPGPSTYFHPFNLEYGSSKNGTGQITQLAIPYAASGHINAPLYLRGRFSNTWSSWYKIWTEGSDGSGSGMDSDLLDGQEGTYYTNFNNLTNRATPTIALSGDVSGSVAVGLQTGTYTISTTIQPNSVALGADTTGNYIATVTGTTNQVNVSGSGSETAAVTLSLPQDIHTGAAPTFSGATLNGLVTVSTNKLQLAASTSSYPSLNIPPGASPNSKTVGDMWHANDGLWFYTGATPYQVALQGRYRMADLYSDTTDTGAEHRITSTVDDKITMMIQGGSFGADDIYSLFETRDSLNAPITWIKTGGAGLATTDQIKFLGNTVFPSGSQVVVGFRNVLSRDADHTGIYFGNDDASGGVVSTTRIERTGAGVIYYQAKNDFPHGTGSTPSIAFYNTMNGFGYGSLLGIKVFMDATPVARWGPSGTYLPGADDTYDFGASSYRWKDGWFAGSVRVGNGTSSNPSFSFTGGGTTGFSYDSTNRLQVSVGGTLVARWGASGNYVPGSDATSDIGANTSKWKDGWFSGKIDTGELDVNAGGAATPSITFADTETGFSYDSTNRLQVSIGGVLVARWGASGNYVPGTTNTYDLGANTATWKDLWLGGVVGSGTWNGSTIGVAYGGTGLASYASGDLLYATGTTTLAKLAKGTANQLLGMNSGATAPEYKTLNGTSNQVTVTHGANSVTLALPQNIHTAAAPTFGALTLNQSGGGAKLTLSGTTSNWITFGAGPGQAAPTFTTSSAGTKIILYSAIGASDVDYAIGAETAGTWFSIPRATNSYQFRWYGGTTERMKLDGMGLLTVGGGLTVNGFKSTLATPTASYATLRLPSGTAPTSPIVGDLWNQGYKLRIRYSDTATHTQATEEYVQSRSENLVTNGSGLFKDNTNFTGALSGSGAMVFDASQMYSGFGGFTYQGADTARMADELIPVDISRRYRFSYYIKLISATDPDPHHYGFITEYDADDNSIGAYHVTKVVGSTYTTLAVDLNPGDPTITLTDATGWNAGATGHQRSIGFFPYTNDQGYTYPDYTYTRNLGHYTNGSSAGLDSWDSGAISGNVITLRSVWAGPAYPAGTKVANMQSAGSYNYIAGSNVTTPTTWTLFEGTVGPTAGAMLTPPVEGAVVASGMDVSSNGGFRWGTSKVAIGWLLSYNTPTTNDAYTAISNVSFGLDTRESTYFRINGTGSATAPAFSFVNDTNTGMYSSGADTLNFVTGGTSRFQVASALTTMQTPVTISGGILTLSTSGGGAKISLAGATSNWITWGATGLGAPAFTTRSAGTKIVLYDVLDGSNVDYGIGIESNALWQSVATTGKSFKWYGGTTTAMTLTGAGNLALVGSVTSGTWTATAVAAAYGGTGQTTYAVGDLLYASGSTTLSKLAGVATGNVLISGGVTTAPSWGKVGLTTHVSGVLPEANGGTNQSTYTQGDLLYASAANTLSKLAKGTANQILGMNAGATVQEYKSLTGTNNQITVTHGTGTITLSTPQDIHSSATPTFGGLTLSTSGLTISGGKLTTVASASGGAGLNLPSGSAPSSPVSGDLWNESGDLKFYNGSATEKLLADTDVAWTTWSPTFTGISSYGSGATTVFRYCQIGKTVHCWFRLVIGSTPTIAGSTAFKISLPVNAHASYVNVPGGNFRCNVLSGTPHEGRMVLQTTTADLFFNRADLSTGNVTQLAMQQATPLTLALSSAIVGWFSYEAA